VSAQGHLQYMSLVHVRTSAKFRTPSAASRRAQRTVATAAACFVPCDVGPETLAYMPGSCVASTSFIDPDRHRFL